MVIQHRGQRYTPEGVPIIGPQPGPQTAFLKSRADIVVYGGAAGGGKTIGLLMEGGRHVHVPGFYFTGFRRTTKQIRNSGSIWDESHKIYPHLGGRASRHDLRWDFPSGARGNFNHLEYESSVEAYDSSQIPLILFDQLEQFLKKQFFYMLSRNRSLCGVRPYIRAAANPPKEPDHWLRKLVDWWIGEDGFPIRERSGVVRFMTRDPETDEIRWVGPEWRDRFGDPAKSFTFIPAVLSDNPILVETNPGYRAGLMLQSGLDQRRLLDGNWNAVTDGGIFMVSWFRRIIDRREVPRGMRLIRYWDMAATEPSDENEEPDWTAGVLAGEWEGQLYIVDIQRFQEGPAGVEKRIRETAEMDGDSVEIIIEQEPGSSGKMTIDSFQRRILKGYVVRGDRPTGDKYVRQKPWNALAERGNVIVVRGLWNSDFFAEIRTYPKGKKDQVDGVSGAYKFLLGEESGYNISDLVN